MVETSSVSLSQPGLKKTGATPVEELLWGEMYSAPQVSGLLLGMANQQSRDLYGHEGSSLNRF